MIIRFCSILIYECSEISWHLQVSPNLCFMLIIFSLSDVNVSYLYILHPSRLSLRTLLTWARAAETWSTVCSNTTPCTVSLSRVSWCTRGCWRTPLRNQPRRPQPTARTESSLRPQPAEQNTDVSVTHLTELFCHSRHDFLICMLFLRVVLFTLQFMCICKICN